jgi:putative SOS response-associated peptidase YedK
MCNLYSVTKSQDAIRKLFGVTRDEAGNMPTLPGIFPDGLAPVVRTALDGERELNMMRWGCPPPPTLGTRPVTNVRNVKSPANDVVRPVHAKAMPVILEPDQFETWMKAPVEEALALQQPFPNERLKVVATGERKDEAA